MPEFDPTKAARELKSKGEMITLEKKDPPKTYGLKHDLAARDFTMQSMLDLYKKKGDELTSLPDYFHKKQLSKEQLETMWDIYRESGSPFIKMLEKGTPGSEGDINRAVFRWNYDLRGDTANVFKHQLLPDWIAEMTHGAQLAQEEGESLYDWMDRRERRGRKISQEKEDFGELRYGIEDDIEYEVKESPNWRGQRENWHESKVFDQYGQEKYGMSPPIPRKSEHSEGLSYIMKWIDPEGDKLFPVKSSSGKMHYESYNPETGFGRNYGVIPEEFDAHKVREPNLWQRIFGKYEDAFGQQEKYDYFR